jgi:phosphatidate cytidylyltransferase
LLLVYYSTPPIFLTAICITVVICLLEYYRLISKGGTRPYIYLGILLGVLIPIAFHYDQTAMKTYVITGGIMTLFIRSLWEREDFHWAMEKIAFTMSGTLFVAWLLAHLILIHRWEGGRFYIFFIFAVIWLGDTTAYYVGKNLGRHKLAPDISPNKTVEGALAGLAGSVMGAFIAKWWFLGQLSSRDAFILGALLGLAGQLGDLSESLVKRSAAVKDSGNIIPGHGGFLDRLDSLIFAAPVLYYYIIAFGENG